MPNWSEVFTEIQALQMQGANANTAVRRKYLTALQAHTGRNVIAYYSGWLSKPGVALSDINDEDKNGFMTTVHKLDRKIGLDLILHTPGGGIAATQSIVTYLQKLFSNNIRAFVPQIAMSAGTIIACSCKEIWMGKQSNLGPIDPQLRGIPAHGVVQEFKRAVKEIKADPSKLLLWQQIIGQYRPTFLGQCEHAIKWSNEFVEQQLRDCMFADLPTKEKRERAKSVTKALSNYLANKTHDRHFDLDACKKMGLKVMELESDSQLQDLILTVHHCYMNLMMNTPAYKVIENHEGVALMKHTATTPGSPLQ